MPERQYQTDEIRFGLEELDLRRAVDEIPTTKFARMKNVMRRIEGGFTSRLGQTLFINAANQGAVVHSLTRLDDPRNTDYTYISGVDTGLYHGKTVRTLAATGFSGNPLALVPYRPPLSSDSWIFVGDKTQMRKIRRDGLTLAIGLPRPTTAATAALAPESKTAIEQFESGFTGRTGTVAATVTNPAAKVNNGLAIALASGVGYGFADKAITVNLNQVGSVPASDDDLLHLWMKVSNPAIVDEVKVYLVCSTTFTGNVVPGTSTTQNTEAYFHVFRPADLTRAIEQSEVSTKVADDAARRRLRDRVASKDPFNDEIDSVAVREREEVLRQLTEQQIPGRDAWTEYGVIDRPLRRGDFQRIGGDTARDWSGITGIVILIRANATGGVTVTLDDLFLTGGSGPDSSEPGLAPYDWRYTHYDLRTGAEGNPSPIMATTLDAARRSVDLTPVAFGNANVRQRWYRRGGRLSANWFFIGTSTTDGQVFRDTVTDDNAEAAGTIAIDHDQPVTTVDANGQTVTAQPLRALWGPVGGLYLVGCGDPYRPGDIYWCAPGEPDHWPAANHLEVTSPSEELLNGCLYNGTGFVFSAERMYQTYPNLSGGAPTFTAVATPCGHGLAGRYGLAVGPEIYFVARDGIYATSGGPERNLSEDDIGPLFHGHSRDKAPSVDVGGYGEGGYGEGGYGTLSNQGITAPPLIDWNFPDKLRLEVHEVELWFSYQDIIGRTQTFIYNLLFRTWRWYLFARPPMVAFSERTNTKSRLLIGSNNGKIYAHTGTNDDSVPIDCLVRTGARPQGALRADKFYGDLAIEADPNGAVLSIRTYINPEETFHFATQIVPTSATAGRMKTQHDHFFGGLLARAVSLEVAWVSDTAQPVIYSGAYSYFHDPDRIEKRVTDWDDLGVAGLKQIKGVVLELDTGGLSKTLVIEGDGAELTRFTVSAKGRQQVEFAFPIVEGRLFRVRPDDTTPFLLYDVSWIADPLPLALKRWEGRAVDHEIWGYYTLFDAFVALKSRADVTFSVVMDGVEELYTIPNTNGRFEKFYIPFRARKGLLTMYTLTSAQPFSLFRGETYVRIVPWGAAEYIYSHPFGGANLDPPTREGAVA